MQPASGSPVSIGPSFRGSKGVATALGSNKLLHLHGKLVSAGNLLHALSERAVQIGLRRSKTYS
ncbi:uncharacterized protein LY79DRAFT_534078 [Colletotrichum navitas]|uniref:Uncharacterized protein n=1 Tax=Colletotrichum navitas TaxID=681940 RepID=A0AAD8VBR5_9PEZI|nr:uncharacterized protein LY79DRAFT_534078 [Colletotrichum navitas]KAK1600574.1 hypothetical protein LY79DRAFT_534078 [Colletotrichum navitas]